MITNYKPGHKLIQRTVVKTGFLALGRAIESASNFEENVKKEIKDWNDGFTFTMNVLPYGPNLAMRKKNGVLKMIRLKKNETADLIVEIKNLSTAFRMITTQMGAHHVFAQNKIGVSGNIADSMRFIRIVYTVEAYMFPKILNKNILKKSPKMDMKKHFNRWHIYTKGMILGK
ncbi:MAG: hypothetical protein L3J74_05815 [Bacteroidales bacterium]|nr:hypothetical protein [Bacteroidales bacterium]